MVDSSSLHDYEKDSKEFDPSIEWYFWSTLYYMISSPSTPSSKDSSKYKLFLTVAKSKNDGLKRQQDMRQTPNMAIFIANDSTTTPSNNDKIPSKPASSSSLTSTATQVALPFKRQRRPKQATFYTQTDPFHGKESTSSQTRPDTSDDWSRGTLTDPPPPPPVKWSYGTQTRPNTKDWSIRTQTKPDTSDWSLGSQTDFPAPPKPVYRWTAGTQTNLSLGTHTDNFNIDEIIEQLRQEQNEVINSAENDKDEEGATPVEASNQHKYIAHQVSQVVNPSDDDDKYRHSGKKKSGPSLQRQVQMMKRNKVYSQSRADEYTNPTPVAHDDDDNDNPDTNNYRQSESERRQAQYNYRQEIHRRQRNKKGKNKYPPASGLFDDDDDNEDDFINHIAACAMKQRGWTPHSISGGVISNHESYPHDATQLMPSDLDVMFSELAQITSSFNELDPDLLPLLSKELLNNVLSLDDDDNDDDNHEDEGEGLHSYDDDDDDDNRKGGVLPGKPSLGTSAVLGGLMTLLGLKTKDNIDFDAVSDVAKAAYDHSPLSDLVSLASVPANLTLNTGRNLVSKLMEGPRSNESMVDFLSSPYNDAYNDMIRHDYDSAVSSGNSIVEKIKAIRSDVDGKKNQRRIFDYLQPIVGQEGSRLLSNSMTLPSFLTGNPLIAYGLLPALQMMLFTGGLSGAKSLYKYFTGNKGVGGGGDPRRIPYRSPLFRGPYARRRYPRYLNPEDQEELLHSLGGNGDIHDMIIPSNGNSGIKFYGNARTPFNNPMPTAMRKIQNAPLYDYLLQHNQFNLPKTLDSEAFIQDLREKAKTNVHLVDLIRSIDRTERRRLRALERGSPLDKQIMPQPYLSQDPLRHLRTSTPQERMLTKYINDSLPDSYSDLGEGRYLKTDDNTIHALEDIRHTLEESPSWSQKHPELYQSMTHSFPTNIDYKNANLPGKLYKPNPVVEWFKKSSLGSILGYGKGIGGTPSEYFPNDDIDDEDIAYQRGNVHHSVPEFQVATPLSNPIHDTTSEAVYGKIRLLPGFTSSQ